MGKKHNKSKAKKKNNNNNNNNNKKTQNKSTAVEPVTQQQLITDVILDSNSLIIKNDSAITTTDTFTELEQDIAKLEEAKAKKDAIIKTTIDSVVASHILDTTRIVEKNNNISEYVKNNKEETKQNNAINQQSPLLPPQNNKIIKAAIDSVVTSHCIDLDSIIKKNNKKITENVKINKESGVTTETNHNSNQQSAILLPSPIKSAIDSVVASHTLDLESIIEKNNNKNNKNEEKNAQKINPTILSPKKNSIIMATIQSVVASHSLDLESILTNVNKGQSSNIKKEEKKDQQVLDSTITTTNSLENNSIIKSTIDSVVASHDLDALSIVQNNKNVMTTSTQQPILEEKMKKKMAASPTGSTSSIRSSNSQHIINSAFLGKPSPTSKTDDTIAKGGILSMPEPAMTSAGLKGKAPLDKRFSTISISKLLPPTPVKGLPEIPSSDEEDNNNYAAASSKNNNTARSPARIDSFEAPVPISKDKHSSKTKRSSLLFDKKNKSKCTIQ